MRSRWGQVKITHLTRRLQLLVRLRATEAQIPLSHRRVIELVKHAVADLNRGEFTERKRLESVDTSGEDRIHVHLAQPEFLRVITSTLSEKINQAPELTSTHWAVDQAEGTYMALVGEEGGEVRLGAVGREGDEELPQGLCLLGTERLVRAVSATSEQHACQSASRSVR